MSGAQTSSLKFKIYNFKLLKRGYPLENRSYQSDNIDYKFTGKQRDTETGYDYFGARYYDARIANWGSVDPLFEKHIGWNPYNYVLGNPMTLIDPDGKQTYPLLNQQIVDEVLSTIVRNPEKIIPTAITLVPEVVIPAAIFGTAVTAIILVTPVTTGIEDVKKEEVLQADQELAITKLTVQKSADLRTAEELVPGSMKRSKSWNEKLAKKTVDEISNIAGDKKDPLRKSAQRMMKLIKEGGKFIQESKRLFEKTKQNGRSFL